MPQADGRFSVLLQIVRHDDAVRFFDFMTSNRDLTLFAPSDEAFDALPPAELQAILEDRDKIRDVLAHILAEPATVVEADIDASNRSFMSSTRSSIRSRSELFDQSCLRFTQGRVLGSDWRAGILSSTEVGCALPNGSPDGVLEVGLARVDRRNTAIRSWRAPQLEEPRSRRPTSDPYDSSDPPPFAPERHLQCALEGHSHQDEALDLGLCHAK